MQVSILIEPMLAHAKLYEEIALACSSEKHASEFRQYSQRCIQAASTAAAFGATAAQFLSSGSATLPSGSDQ
jgi:hypothetical protein